MPRRRPLVPQSTKNANILFHARRTIDRHSCRAVALSERRTALLRFVIVKIALASLTPELYRAHYKHRRLRRLPIFPKLSEKCDLFGNLANNAGGQSRKPERRGSHLSFSSFLSYGIRKRTPTGVRCQRSTQIRYNLCFPTQCYGLKQAANWTLQRNVTEVHRPGIQIVAKRSAVLRTRKHLLAVISGRALRTDSTKCPPSTIQEIELFSLYIFSLVPGKLVSCTKDTKMVRRTLEHRPQDSHR